MLTILLDEGSPRRTRTPTLRKSNREALENAVRKAQKERALIAKEHAILVRKYRKLEKAFVNWSPDEIKNELSCLAQTLKEETDHGTEENLVTHFSELMMKVVNWKKADRDIFYRFVSTFIFATKQDRAHVKILQPFVDVFRRAKVPETQAARMTKNERSGLEIIELWANDVARAIEALGELQLSWSPRETFDLAKHVSPEIAAKFQLLGAQMNGFLSGHTDQIKDVLYQVGFLVRNCAVNFGENKKEEISQQLHDVTEHINTDAFDRFSLALSTLQGMLRNNL